VQTTASMSNADLYANAFMINTTVSFTESVSSRDLFQVPVGKVRYVTQIVMWANHVMSGMTFDRYHVYWSGDNTGIELLGEDGLPSWSGGGAPIVVRANEKLWVNYVGYIGSHGQAYARIIVNGFELPGNWR